MFVFHTTLLPCRGLVLSRMKANKSTCLHFTFEDLSFLQFMHYMAESALCEYSCCLSRATPVTKVCAHLCSLNAPGCVPRTESLQTAVRERGPAGTWSTKSPKTNLYIHQYTDSANRLVLLFLVCSVS